MDDAIAQATIAVEQAVSWTSGDMVIAIVAGFIAYPVIIWIGSAISLKITSDLERDFPDIYEQDNKQGE